jgi:MFS family permease
LARGWSIGWLAGFLFAEFYLMARLGAMGDRWAGGPSLEPRGRRPTLAVELSQTLLAIVVFYLVGAKLDADTGALGLFGGDGIATGSAAGFLARPAWGVLAYLATYFYEFGTELAHSRSARQPYVSSSTLAAMFFFGSVVVGGFLVPFVGFFLSPFFGEHFMRGVFAVLMVLARCGADVAVAWYPHWAPALARWKPVPRPDGVP